ncbi:MAG TPA: SCO family protein [Candidatus Helicobacter avicola]|nr:SCO family protein [Candidatus Helicobacter avicola]
MKRLLLVVVVFCVSFGAVFMWLEHGKYDFLAQTTSGQKSLQDFKGRNLIVYFGYTFCPDVCPITLSFLAQALRQVDSTKFTLLFITLDPHRDTPADCQSYAQSFFDSAYGLWLDPSALSKVAAHYGVRFEKIPMPDSAMQYSIAHTSTLYLFDEKGNFRESITNPTIEQITQSLNNLSSKEQ